MSRIAICTDASALVPAGVARTHAVTVVAIAVALDGEPFDQRRGVDEFYGQLQSGAHATTSQPSPGDFVAAYEDAAARGAREVVSIHLDARVSGTVSTAELAAREAPVAVTVVDAGTVSFGVAVCVRAAARLAQTGASAGEISEQVRTLGAALRNVFVAAAAPDGRVGAASAWAVLAFSGGAAQPVEAAASEDEAVVAMASRVAGSREDVHAAVGHAAASTARAADALADALTALPNVSGVERYRVGPAVGAHTGPRSFGAFWWPAALDAPR